MGFEPATIRFLSLKRYPLCYEGALGVESVKLGAIAEHVTITVLS